MESLLPRVVAALVLALAVAPVAQAADEPTGGAVAWTVPKVKKVTVKQIQKALGFKRPDGILGPKTKRALKRFQRANGLRADGVPRRATLVALGLLAAPQPATLASLPPAVASVLTEIAECESGGDPTAVSANGKHRGKYQFAQATWEDLGGIGDPATAEEALQDALAAQLYAERGIAPWPTCGARATADT